MSALSTRLTRGAWACTASTARLITSIASSQVSASIVVNIEVVSLGRPDSRTTRTASATAALTLSPGVPAGAMLKAKSMWPHCPSRPRSRDPRRSVISVSRLRPDDRADWEELFRGYIAFYERSIPDEEYDRAWREFQHGSRMHALGARWHDRLVGIAHFFVHPHTNAGDVCYLQDL